MNARVPGRTRTSQPRVRLETCAFATVAGARGEPVPTTYSTRTPVPVRGGTNRRPRGRRLRTGAGSGASRDEPAVQIVVAWLQAPVPAWPGTNPLAWWCGWGSWGGPVWERVQICHKGVSRRDRPRSKARNLNVSLRVSRRDPGLCSRFGQHSPSGASEEGSAGPIRSTTTTAPAAAPPATIAT